MSTILSDPTSQIARRLVIEREARGWSQADLAARAGVSRAMIGKIERGEASPTASLLGKLSGALEITMAMLLARAEGAGTRLMKAADQPVWRDPETGYRRRQRFARPGGALELVEVELPASSRVSYPAASYAFLRHLVWVLEGQLTIQEGGQLHALHAGDCLEFGEAADTTYANPGPVPCRYVVVVGTR
jgi:transcriptional regulator with XRE-family HTH domain